MANEATIQVVGNATDDAQLRFTPSGVAQASWTLAVTSRTKIDGQWTDGDTTFYRCTLWRDAAEHAAETITKGMRLVVVGRFKARPFETQDGEKRLSLDIDVDEVGPSLRYATAKVTRVQGGSSRSRGGAQEAEAVDDPWRQAPVAAGAGYADTEPPF